MAEMQVMQILAQGDQRQDSSIGERNTFVEDEVSNSRGVGDDGCEVGVSEASTLC